MKPQNNIVCFIRSTFDFQVGLFALDFDFEEELDYSPDPLWELGLHENE